MKKLLSILCAAAVILTLSACKKNSGDSDMAAAPTENSENSTGTVSDNGAPPEKPEGDSGNGGPSGDANDGSSNSVEGNTPPEMPSTPDGSDTPPEKPSGSDNSAPIGAPDSSKIFTAGDETISIDISDSSIVKNSEAADVSDISEGDVLQVTFNDSGKAKTVIVMSLENNFGSGNASFGASGEITEIVSANTISENGEYSGETYTSTGDDENALQIDGATVTLSGITVDKSAGATSNTENGDFYGVNAALLATNGATITIKNATVNSSAQNGNGVFSYGSNTTVNISDSTITTAADNSGGIQTTGGGTTNASNLTVSTSGNSSAAIRSDRGGGTVNVNGGSYTSNGYNSPAVYSTASITVSDAALTANNSEALVIEGQNSITLNNCTVIGNMSDTQGTSSDENVHNVMIYQSMSGDADVGTSEFSMTGGSLTSKNGDMFYVTNTHCKLTLSGAELKNEDAEAYLLRVTGNSASHGWGTAGSNGAQVEFTADAQTLEGNIVVDSISTLNMTLKNGSTFTGTVNITDNAQNGAAVSDNAVITVESGCTWSLTGNCTVTSLTNNGTIDFNGYTITLADGTVLK